LQNQLQTETQEQEQLRLNLSSLTASLQEKESDCTRLAKEKNKIEAYAKDALKKLHTKFTTSIRDMKSELQVS